MPWAPKRPCAWPGCPELVDRGKCEKRRRQERRQVEERRGTAASRGYGSRWARASKQFLRENPLCVNCMPRIVPSTVTDHIIPHRGDQRLFWDRSNWQPLCKPCHDSKTASSDGRWSQRAS